MIAYTFFFLAGEDSNVQPGTSSSADELAKGNIENIENINFVSSTPKRRKCGPSDADIRAAQLTCLKKWERNLDLQHELLLAKKNKDLNLCDDALLLATEFE